jgi:hypothetical protein
MTPNLTKNGFQIRRRHMRITKVWFVGLIVWVFIGFFIISTVYAQGWQMNDWVGKWFKITVKAKGYKFDESGFVNYNQTIVVYIKVTAWVPDNPDDKVLQGLVYQEEEDIWSTWPINLHYIAGNNLDFLCWFEQYSEDSNQREKNGFTARITGSVSGGALKSAKFKSLGGYEWAIHDVPGCSDCSSGKARGTTLTGSLIADAKLPPDLP